jgi:hypothetical protein
MKYTISVEFAFCIQLCLAQAVLPQFSSSSGDFTMRWLRSHEESCATREPQGYYSLSGGASGLLYPTDCGSSSASGDSAEYRFIDTNGAERCAGSMIMLFGTRAVKTIWQIQEAVSGYPCSTLGKSYEVRLY